MKITRKFTKPGQDPFATTEWVKRQSRISNPDGSVVFEMNDAEVPTGWSQLATDIMVSKYFRKAGVPQKGDDGKALKDESGKPVLGPERSARQVIHRLAGCWRHWGATHGYFDTEADAQAFYDEIAYMLVHQMCAPNSPQWFNTGLNWAYGINGPAQGHHYPDPETGEVRLSEDAYTHPQPHACFIQSVEEVRLGHGDELLAPSRRERAALGRRQEQRADELAEDRRPGGGGDQERRDDAPGGEDGVPGYGPPGRRGLHQLEGARGDQGRGAGRGHEARAQGPARDGREAGPEADLRLQRRGVQHGLGSERQQLAADPRRVLRGDRRGRRLVDDLADDRRGVQDREGAGPVGPDRLRGVAVRGPGRAVRLDDQRVAHLPGGRSDQREQPVLGVHVPGQHGVQPGVVQPAEVLRPEDARAGR